MGARHERHRVSGPQNFSVRQTAGLKDRLLEIEHDVFDAFRHDCTAFPAWALIKASIAAAMVARSR